MSFTIYPVDLGETQVDCSMLAWQTNIGEKTRCPVLGWLIMGEEKPILVDTGFRSAEDLTNAGVPAKRSDDQTLEAQLATYDLRPDDIGSVILTHLHVDHCGLTHQLKNAQIFVQRRELQFAAAPLFPAIFYDHTDLVRLFDDLSPQLTLLDGSRELFPGIRTVVTQGHTPAHQMVFVELESGTAVIVGDAAYSYSLNIEQQIPPGYYYNLQSVTEDLQLIKQQTHVLMAHEPGQYERYAAGVK